jgi:hypothetical protein
VNRIPQSKGGGNKKTSPKATDNSRYAGSFVKRNRRRIIVGREDKSALNNKTAEKAYAGWSYKNRDKSKDKEKAEKERIIARWMRENKKFVRLLDRVAFEIHVGKWGYEDKVDAKLVKDLLEENGYTDLPFSAGDLLTILGQRSSVLS